MNQLLNIVKGNFLQHVRSYHFLVTIGITLLFAFGFIPSPDSNYTTVKFGDYTGEYNSAWIGFVTALLSSTILSLFGFFLINGGIKKDIDSRIGHIIGSTQISNAKYIFTKILSNFLILFTILIVIFFVSICLFYLYSNGYPFQIGQFILPFVYIAIPSLLFVSTIAIVVEVIFPKWTFVQYLFFLALYVGTLFTSPTNESFLSTDIYGVQYPTEHVKAQLSSLHPNADTNLSIGFVAGSRDPEKLIELEDNTFPQWYLFQRIFIILLSIIIAFLSSLFFHRFDIKRSLKANATPNEKEEYQSAGFQISNLNTALDFQPGILPLIKAELKLLFRSHSKWILILTISGMIAIIFTSTSIAHQFILPILWFLQLSIWSDLTSKDYMLRTHYFTASAYKPIQRLFVSRVLAGYIVAVVISSPLLLKLIIEGNFIGFLNILIGGGSIVLLAVFLGVLTKGKKLFEVVFFFIIYCNINSVMITDYFGALHNNLQYTIILIVINLILFSSSQLIKQRYEK